MKRALYWFMLLSLLPGLLAQGLWLRRRAPRFAPAAGPQAGYCRPHRGGCAQDDIPLRVIGLGDSIIAGVGAGTMTQSLTACLARALAGLLQRPVQWQAVGRSGAASSDIVAELLPHLPPQACDVIVLSLGVNDITGLTSSRWTARHGV